MDLLTFTFNHAEIRGIEEHGQRWLVAADVAHVLGYLDLLGAIVHHCTGPGKWLTLQLGGETQQLRLLSEQDVVRLIVGSDSSAAANLERSVPSDYLYEIVLNFRFDDSNTRELLNDVAFLRALLDQFREQKYALQLQISEHASKSRELDMTADLAGSLSLEQAANALQMSQQI